MRIFYPALIMGLISVFPVFAKASPDFLLDKNVEELPFEVSQKLVLVNASVNGQTGCFLLDTGVGKLTLNERLFGSNSRDADLYMGDLNGVLFEAKEVLVHSFNWGALHREDFYTHVLDLEVQEAVLGCKLLGLIGQEVLNDLEMLVDYDARRITLFRLDGEGEATGNLLGAPDHRIAFRMEEHIPVFEVEIGDRNMASLGIDSGSSLNIMDVVWKKRLEDEALSRREISFRAALSSRRVDYFTLPSLDIAEQVSLIHCKVAFTSMTYLRDNNINVDGLLGVDLFRLGRVALNYQKKEVRIWVSDNVFALKYRPLSVSP